MLKLVFLFLSILFTTLSNATTYYVSPNGNDSNNGTSIATPWKTIGKVNTRQLFAGDQILFEKNGTYRGNLVINYSGAVGNPILVSSYGSGDDPILSGSQLTSNWIVHQGNIWKTQISSSQVIHLFFNDSLMTIARFPNNGWLRNDQGSNSQINDSELNQPSGYWNGSTLVIRSTGWSYDTAKVFSYDPGVLNFRPISPNLGNRTWGYFIRNKFEELDLPGEWFFNPTQSTLYFYPPNGVNPNDVQIEIVTNNLSTNATGVRVPWQRNNIVIENLTLSRYGYAGVATSGANNIIIRNCKIDQCDEGIRVYGNNQTISNNEITRCTKIAINSVSGGGLSGYGNNNIIEDNNIENCSIYVGLGQSNWGYFGLGATGFNNIIRRNRIVNIGYIALSFEENAIVENNYIERACSILNDGSGIAFDNTDGAIIRNNIVISTIGNVESCATNWTGCDPKGKGIYFGNIRNRNVLVEGNTVAYCNGAGIWFDHTMLSQGNRLINNTLFGNNLYQLGISDYSNYNGPGAVSPFVIQQYADQSITGNIFYSTDVSQKTMYHINRWFSGVDFARFDSNYYVNPFDTTSIQVWDIAGGGASLNYSLSQWRLVRGDDSLSSNHPYLPESQLSDHILVYNPSLSTQNISLPPGIWRDLYGNNYQSSIELVSFGSKPLYRLSNQFVNLALKVFLGGCYSDGLMYDSLRVKGLLPLVDPYPGLGYNHIIGGNQITTQSVLSVVGNSAIVDWVVVELRDVNSPSTRLFTRSALLQRDGDVVDVDGISPVLLQVDSGQYYISVRHRNHLGVMTQHPILLQNNTMVDFTLGQTYGIGAQKTIGLVKTMWDGNCNFDNLLKYVGQNNDRDPILARIGGVIPTNITLGYLSEDVNMDGVVKYIGQNNDRDPILLNIGGSIPTNTKVQQIP